MKINSNIACTVNECKYHAKKEDYCSLEQIKVVKNSNVAKDERETDCHSFEAEMR
ncbi:MAG: DUF1540 domain-containing protein [Eubacteriales bacterium]